MKTIMKLENLTVEQMELFLTGSQPIVFAVASDKDERYKFVDGVLKRYGYTNLKSTSGTARHTSLNNFYMLL